jgi:DNA-binding GntR family transcriptional regulator
MGKLSIQHENLDYKVYQTIRTMIIERRLTPGTKIFQDKLAQELGVSRTPLVNALKKLEHERLITAIPRRGFFVRLISKEEMIQIFELREVLEGLAARRAAKRISNAQVKKLQRFFRNIPISDELEDVQKYAEEDRQFHKFVVEVGGKEILANILDTYNIITFSYHVDRQAGLIRSPHETIQEHQAIIEAISARDPLKAEEAARQHLANSAKRLRREIEENAKNAPALPFDEQPAA